MSKIQAKRGIRQYVDEVKEEAPVKRSLLDEKVEMIKQGKEEPRADDADEEINASVLEDLGNKKSLMSVQELANDVKYTEPMKTDWRPPRHIRETTEEVRHVFFCVRDVSPTISETRNMKSLMGVHAER